MKVLVVVEDDADMRLLIELTLQVDRRLEMSGACATAEEAVEAARRVQPGLVILDHFIEGDVMGLEAAPLIKAVAPEAIVLLFTSHDLEVEASREPAVDRYLSKRKVTELLPVVQELLGLEPAVA